MKKYFICIILSLLFASLALARSTGCKEGNCENGFGKWVYTDKTTYEESGQSQKKMDKELKLGLMVTFTKVNLEIVSGVE